MTFSDHSQCTSSKDSPKTVSLNPSYRLWIINEVLAQIIQRRMMGRLEIWEYVKGSGRGLTWDITAAFGWMDWGT
jgi:hypothetical protein